MKLIALFCTILLSAQLVAQVPDKPEDISPLLIGEKIPDVTLKTIKGKDIKTSSLWSGQKTILIFYRGGWCPYCNQHLAEVGQVQQDLLDLGYKIVAISPDAPAALNKSIDKHHLEYSLYADEGGTFIKALGLAYKAPAHYDKILQESSEGKNTEKLIPVPTLFIVNEQGEILFEYINPNFKVRIRKELLLSVAKTLVK